MRATTLTPLSAAVLTVAYLFGGLLVGIGLGFVIGAPPGATPHTTRNVAAGVIAVAVMTAAAAMWAKEILQRAESGGDATRARWAGAVSFGPATLAVGLMLTVLEKIIVEQGRGPSLPVHVVYAMLFIPGSLVVATVAGVALGVGLRLRGRELWRLAVASGLAACVAYLAIYLLMDLLGWRVGAPGASRRATMLVVTSLGCLGATAAGGAAIGAILSRRSLSATPARTI
jgi:hypothetical protein